VTDERPHGAVGPVLDDVKRDPEVEAFLTKANE
jgi:hypothetical protein